MDSDLPTWACMHGEGWSLGPEHAIPTGPPLWQGGPKALAEAVQMKVILGGIMGWIVSPEIHMLKL